jgi:hypothetical protein
MIFEPPLNGGFFVNMIIGCTYDDTIEECVSPE